MPRRLLLAAITAAVSLGVFSACAPEPTALHFGKTVAQVTPADQEQALWDWRHFVQMNPTLVCIRSHETGAYGYPYVSGYGYATGNGYFGAYQYLPGTWNVAAATVGRPDLVGILPSDVAWWDQDEVTIMYHNIVGDGPWGNRC